MCSPLLKLYSVARQDLSPPFDQYVATPIVQTHNYITFVLPPQSVGGVHLKLLVLAVGKCCAIALHTSK